ncbi:PHA/PHB synthase family protein [Humitalea rosea]|nr:alpha/beta fold hydrolase [Humitalea rosea]
MRTAAISTEATPGDLLAAALRTTDLAATAALARVTSGLSPVSLYLAYADWALHLAMAPGKRMELALSAATKAGQFIGQAALAIGDPGKAAPIALVPGDRRFRDSGWQDQPYRSWYDMFMLSQQWWSEATLGVNGVAPHHEDVVAFTARQLLDMVSPSNIAPCNPEITRRTMQSGGANLIAGAGNLLGDLGRRVAGEAAAGTEAFRPGHEVAQTPGKVIHRNRLVELIQYAPATESVHAEPILIVPAWIMKYYILDLSPHNSLIGYLVAKGHTVFCLSWHNPDAEDRDTSFDDYRRLGIAEALDAIGAVLPGRRVHGVGYCLGGTLLTIAAAAMARAGDERLATVTLLAAQTDFSEPGELQLFIDHSEVALLEGMMWERGFLDSKQMAGAFQILQSNDLIWSRMVHDYLMGDSAPMIDLTAWNADATRMPYRMHSEYLRHLFLENSLASATYIVDGHPVSTKNIEAPIFVVGTERDHVAPWRSVFKIHYLSDADVTFVLTSGGHNAGIVSEPGHPRREFRLRHKAAADQCVSPDEWLALTPPQPGSWWQPWQEWLAAHSSPAMVQPPVTGAARRGYPPLCDAPGIYVHEA